MSQILSTALVIVLLAACSQIDNNNQVTRAEDEAAIRATYDAWANAADSKDIESWVTFLGPDAIFLPPNTEALTTYEDIRNLYIRIFEDPNWSISCEHTEVEIAEAGDMAWSRGYCNTTVSGPDDNIIKGRGKWNKVWLKQANGSWKNRLNSFSPTHPQNTHISENDEINLNLNAAEAFVDAFYSFDAEKLNAVLSNATDSIPKYTFYQGWAKGGNYQIINRKPCFSDGEIIGFDNLANVEMITCSITVQDDLMKSLEIEFNVTDTFHLTVSNGKIVYVDNTSNDLKIFRDAQRWVRQERKELIDAPCEGYFSGGPTPEECVKAYVKGFTEYSEINNING